MSGAISIARAAAGINPGIYDDRDFAAVAQLLREATGIVLQSSKKVMVYSRLAPLVRDSGSVTFSAFLALARTAPDVRTRLIAALTTNHTFFYRESHHFEHFAQVTRPQILSTMRSGRGARLWSAGCSSGEETWSLLMTLLGPDRAEGMRIAEGDLILLASDIAGHALHTAQEARYRAADVVPVPAPLRTAWTVTEGEDTRMAAEMRSIARFRTLNLQGRWPFSRKFDVIFCRNVMIYFDNPTKERLVQRFADAIVPGGYLYIGHSERVTGPAERLFEPVGPTIYRRRPA